VQLVPPQTRKVARGAVAAEVVEAAAEEKVGAKQAVAAKKG
jgi:hypothetical protein